MMVMFYSLPLEFAPGHTWSYSNTGYFLLGKVAESVTRIPFFTTVEQTLTAPLGMFRTRACDESWNEGCLARGYVPTRDGLKPARVLTSNYAFSSGAWAVSGEDMVAYMKAMHRRALPADKAGFDWRLKAAHPDHPFQYYGGRFFSTYHGRHIAAHNGGTPGFSSSWIYVEEDTASIIILANRQDYAPVDCLAWDILACFLPGLRYPSHAIESPEGREWGEVVLAAIDSVRTDRPLPSHCSKPLRTFMESENGRGLWKWYFSRGFPAAIVCVDAESSEGLRQFRFRLAASAGTEYRLTAVVNTDNELVRLFW
jgi:CubicO group peptidase (beta-lactamase class C family)